MNFFRSEEHIRKWAQFDSRNEEGIISLNDLVKIFSGELFRRRLDLDYFSHIQDAYYQEQIVQGALNLGICCVARKIQSLQDFKIVNRAVSVSEDSPNFLLRTRKKASLYLNSLPSMLQGIEESHCQAGATRIGCPIFENLR